MYSDKVMDHFEHPRNVGEIENASGVGTVGNAKCGDIMKMYIKVNDGVILWLRCGCGHQQHGHRNGKGKDHRGGHAGDQ